MIVLSCQLNEINLLIYCTYWLPLLHFRLTAYDSGWCLHLIDVDILEL